MCETVVGRPLRNAHLRRWPAVRSLNDLSGHLAHSLARPALHLGISQRPANLGQNIVITLLKGYRLLISPLLPGQCRFTPSCSRYAMEAVEKKGVVKGLFWAGYRLLRCHPFSAGGLDELK